jgi:hypothetical protein
VVGRIRKMEDNLAKLEGRPTSKPARPRKTVKRRVQKIES